MKQINTFKIIAILLISLCGFSARVNSQTIVFNEDFETVTTLSYTSPQSNLDGLTGWSYDNTNTGRLQFDAIANSGNYAAFFDTYVNNSYSFNYLTLTADMSAYASNNNLFLSFYFTDIGDESDGNDIVEVRGSNNDSWIKVFDLWPASYTDYVWNHVTGIDLLAALSSNGQVATSTLQVRFTQYDNRNGNDGIAFDDVQITTDQSVYVTDIVHKQYTTCNLANGLFEVYISNVTGNDYSNFPVTLTMTLPDLTTSPYTKNYPGTLAAGTSGKVSFNTVDISDIGTYSAHATISIAGPLTYGKTKTIYVSDAYSTPWKEDFTSTIDRNWNFGTGFIWSQGDYIYQTFSGNDTLTTPSISVNKADYYLTYKINPGYFNSNDTVIIQIGEACTGNYTNIDTVINDGTHNGRYNDVFNPYTIGYALQTLYFGKKIQVRYVAHFHSGNSFVLDEVYVRPGRDIEVTQILLESHPYCGTNSYGVSVVVQNMAPKTQSNIKIDLEVYGQTKDNITGTLTNAILFGEVDTLVMGTFDASLAGLYELIATATIPNDDYPSNNRLSKSFEIEPPVELPVILSSDFDQKNWGPTTSGPGVTFGTNRISTDAITVNKKASFVTFKVGPVTQNSYLAFDYRIQSDDVNDDLGIADIINISVSPGCEGNFIQRYFIDRDAYTANGGYQTTPSIDLAPYLGQEIVVKIEAKNGPTADETSWFTLDVDNLHIGPADISVNGISYSFDTWCGENNASFDVLVQNTSSVKALNVPVTLEVTSAFSEDKLITIVVPQIDPGSTTVTFNPYDLSLPDEYQLNANAAYTNDYDNSNNEFHSSVTIQEVETLPVLETFDPFAVNWFSNDQTEWNSTTSDALGVGSDDNSYIYTDELAYNNSADIYTFKFGPVSAGDKIEFDYLVNTYDNSSNLLGNYLRDNDKITVSLSTDCGDNWTIVYTIDNTNHNNTNAWQTVPAINLTAYAGQELRARFEVIKGNATGTVQFALNSFQVITSGDAGVVEVDVPQYYSNVAVCGKASDQAMVVVQNFGLGTISSVPVALDVVYSGDTTSFYGTTGTIAPEAVDTIYISGFNSVQAGDYELIGYTQLAGDIDETNDLVGTSGMLTVQELGTVPYYYSGTSMPADWQYYETSGAGWTSSTDIIGNGSNYLATPLLNESDTALITVQKVGPIGSNYMLRIDYNAFAYDNDGTFLSNFMRDGDKLEIQISEDCGANYTTVETFDQTNHMNMEEDTQFEYDLGASYSGSDISVRLFVVKGSTIGKLRVGFSSIKVTIPAADLNLASVFTEDEVCGKAAEPVYAVVSNNSVYESISGFNISTEVVVDNVVETNLSKNYTGTLLPGDVDTVLVGTFNSQSEVEYTLNTVVTYANDVDDSNNAIDGYKFIIYEPKAGDYAEDFSNSPDAWKSRLREKFMWTGSSMQTASLAPNDVAWMYSPKMGAIGVSNYVQYDWEIASGEFAIGDKVELYVSNDCGATFSLLNTLDNADNLSTFNKGTVMASLATYQGDNLIFRFVVNNSNGANFSMVIDNFMITYTDIEVLGIVNQTDKFNINTYNPDDGTFNYAERYITCGSSTDSLFVVLENKGFTPVSSVPVTINIAGKVTTSLSKTFTTTLNPGQRGWLYMGTVNSQTPGLLDMEAVINVTGDDVSKNDRIGFSVTTQEVYDIPFDAFNSGNFNEDQYWKYDDKGKMVNNKPGWWTDLVAEGLDKGDTAYAFSPKLYIDGTAFVYFNYAVSNSLNEGHIIHGEVMQVLVSANCGSTLTSIWTMDVNSTDFAAQGSLALDLSAYTGQDIRLIFRAIKGYSSGLFTASFDNINVKEYSPVEIQLLANGMSMPSGSTLCEGTTITLSNMNGTVPGITNYLWQFVSADTTYIAGNSSTISVQLQDYNTGDFTLTAWGLSQSISYTDQISVTISPLPTLPVITGHTAVVTNVLTTDYTATALYADSYVWSIQAGTAQIVGDQLATVYWPLNGYVGMATIEATGENSCGAGQTGSLLVYVDYLNPQGGDNGDGGVINPNANNDVFVFSASPNPSTGQFAVNLPDNTKNATISIKNSQGNTVTQQIISSDVNRIDISNQPSGIYFIMVTIGDKVYTQNMVIE